MSVKLPDQPITDSNIEMFVRQIDDLTKDPYLGLNYKLQISLRKLNSYLAGAARSKNQVKMKESIQLMGELLTLFLSAKSHLELIVKCEKNTDAQREAATKAITEENSELFAKKIVGVIDNTEWFALNRG
jgi:hypothetical protein